MKLSEKLKQYSSSHPFYFFEFFPPQTDAGFQNLLSRISRLSKLSPLAISITWGAGGSTKDRSLDLAGMIQREYSASSSTDGIDTILHLTCTNMMGGMVDHVLRSAKGAGIQNILALRGDPPRGKEEWIPVDPRFQHAIDLVKYIRSSEDYNDWFSIGVAGYPEGHPDVTGTAEKLEIARLKEKVDAGADFIVTQLFYDVDKFITWVDKVRAAGITVPIIPGIMPIQTYASFQRVTKLCGASLPTSVQSDLEPIKHDDALVKAYGIDLAVSTIRRITSEGKIQGVHFCTLNLEKSVQRVLEELNWTGRIKPARNKLITEDDTQVPPSPGGRPGSSTFLVTPTSAGTSARAGLSSIPSTVSAVGSGELNNAASWDDFPNGRFGDFKSPAFGDTGPWGNAPAPAAQISSHWPAPNSMQSLTELFLAQLHSQIPSTPFSPGPLSAETTLILPELLRMTKERGWWTVGSQPAVDCAPSSHPTFGWGPQGQGGYVFQKGFVEFFCEERDVLALEQRIASTSSGSGFVGATKNTNKARGMVHWFAGNSKGELKTNVQDGGRNAVTWGIFPGQEVVQSTIIERESFEAWKDEAFSIWTKWASHFPPDSVERTTLESVKKDRWLVSIVHHNYKDTNGLWDWLFDDLGP